MSDDAEQIFTAWKAVFGHGQTKKLLCAWHVDRAWRRALRDSIPNRNKQTEVYHQLRLLLSECDKSKFHLMLQQFLTYISTHEKKFFLYFQSFYTTRFDQWASAFRSRTTVNTNMFTEAFHRTLKVVYLQSKQNRRMDYLLTTLLKLARDKAFERFVKLEKGKTSHRICEINKRHKSAIQWSIKIDDDEWKVPSQNSSGIEYTVTRVKIKCDCFLRCSNCDACIHMYTCNCVDATIHSTLCKHTHLVCLPSTSTSTSTLTVNGSTSDHKQVKNYFSKILQQSNASETDKIRRNLQCKLQEVHQSSNNIQNKEALKAAYMPTSS